MPVFQVQITTPSHGCFSWFHVLTIPMRYAIMCLYNGSLFDDIINMYIYVFT